MERKVFIERVTNPEEGPLDGVRLHTDCAATRFAQDEESGERKIAEQSLQDCAILASYQEGTMSVSVRGDINMMFTVRIDELFALMKMAADASIELKEKEETKE